MKKKSIVHQIQQQEVTGQSLFKSIFHTQSKDRYVAYYCSRYYRIPSTLDYLSQRCGKTEANNYEMYVRTGGSFFAIINKNENAAVKR